MANLLHSRFRWPMSVLLVEDEEVNRRILSAILGRMVTEVRQAVNGLEALRMCEEAVPDVLITDLSMPELDGRRLIEELDRRGLAMEVMVLTAHNSVDVADLTAAQCQILFKPLRVQLLADALGKIARKRGLSGKSGAEPPGPSSG